MQTHVIFNTAVSLDGRVGKKDKQIVFSNKLDNYRVHRLRGSVDAILIGVETVLSDDPEITVSEQVTKPYRVIVDSKGEIPLNAKVLDGSAKTIVAVSRSINPMKVKQLEEKGVEVLPLGEYAVHLRDLLWTLNRKGIKKALLEGSGTLSRRMFNEGYVNELYATITPVLIGEGINLFNGELDRHIEMNLEGILQYGDQVVLHYMVRRGDRESDQ
jgi:2,5-diamino-6-hydroxy-4-(5-phosphoribosylamino)pyrimidine 1'-reductase